MSEDDSDAFDNNEQTTNPLTLRYLGRPPRVIHFEPESLKVRRKDPPVDWITAEEDEPLNQETEMDRKLINTYTIKNNI
jgi:hypothetical protein